MISTYNVTTATTDHGYPDVCYDSFTGRYSYFYEEAFSSSDQDILTATLNVDGSFYNGGYIENGAESWIRPAAAIDQSLAKILVVAERVLPNAASDVVGRLYVPSTLSLGAEMVIAASGSGINSA